MNYMIIKHSRVEIMATQHVLLMSHFKKQNLIYCDTYYNCLSTTIILFFVVVIELSEYFDSTYYPLDTTFPNLLFTS